MSRRTRYFKNEYSDLEPGARVTLKADLWKARIVEIVQAIVEGQPPTFKNCDGGLYVGCSGIAYMLYYLSESSLLQDLKDELLTRACNYTDVALSYAKNTSRDPQGSFLLGSAGTYAVASLVYASQGKEQQSAELRLQYRSLAAMHRPVNALPNGSDEMFMGRAGYLCGTLLLERQFNKDRKPDNVVVPQETYHALCASAIHSGREYAKRNKSPCPLMYEYYSTEYLGAGHGLSAILQMLLCFPSYLRSDPSAEQDVHATVDYMLSLMQPNSNIVPVLGENVRHEKDELVHWCHGAPGVVYLFGKAFLYWNDDKYLQACLKCGELTWQKGLLYKGPGICHGVAGSGYVFLLLYRLTSDERHLHRALKFAEFLYTEEFQSEARQPDTPYSLYEGKAGTVAFLLDLLQPKQAEFPFFDIFSYKL